MAGLQTRGKAYLATGSNIARFTRGRLQPRERLADEARPIEGPPAPAWRPLPPTGEVDSRRPYALLLTEDDLAFESLGLPEGPMVGVAAVPGTEGRSPLGVSPVVAGFEGEAMGDALARVEASSGVTAARLGADWGESVTAWVMDLGVDQVVTPYAPIGPARSRLDRIDALLGEKGIRLVRIRRRWDEELWPLATSGYFGFKKELEASLGRLGLLKR